MKNLIAVFSLVVLAAAGSALAQKPDWTEDYEAALAKAKTEKKMVLLDFTGSDWCGWCIKLDREVFSKEEFKTYAKDNLVLVELDFPQKKEQSKEVKKQNEKLAKKYNIEGYPTIIVLNSAGKQIGTLGYMPGGPSAFIGELNKLKDK